MIFVIFIFIISFWLEKEIRHEPGESSCSQPSMVDWVNVWPYHFQYGFLFFIDYFNGCHSFMCVCVCAALNLHFSSPNFVPSFVSVLFRDAINFISNNSLIYLILGVIWDSKGRKKNYTEKRRRIGACLGFKLIIKRKKLSLFCHTQSRNDGFFFFFCCCCCCESIWTCKPFNSISHITNEEKKSEFSSFEIIFQNLK